MTASPELPLVIGRYTLIDKIGSGGMASVFLGRMSGAAGLSRTVAIKRLHAHLAEGPELRLMLLDEARITMRIRHPNVVPTIDVVQLGQELLIVMEHVVGASLARLIGHATEQGERMPPELVATILAAVLHGLHAAHEVKDEQGEPLGVVHRDVSPQNILVGADGTTRVLDFGIAKAAGRMHATRDGQAKGKLAYMAPEQLETTDVDARTDVFASGVVLWEALTGKRLFAEPSEAMTMAKVLRCVVPPPSTLVAGLDPRFDEICARALQRSPRARHATARDMALALEACGTVPSSVVASYVERACGDDLRGQSARAQRVALPHAGGAATTTPEREVTPDDAPTRREAIGRSAPPPRVDETMPTLLSVSASPESPRKPAKRAPWSVLGGVAAAVAVVAVVLRATQGHGAPSPQSAPANAPVVPSAVDVAPPRASPDPAREVPPPPDPSAPASPSATAASVAAAATARRASPPPSARAAPSASKPKCTVVPVAQPDGTLDFVERCE